MDILAGAELLGAIAQQPNPGQILADFRTILALANSIKASGLDVPGMIKAGTLQGEAAAIGRTATLANTLLADKTHGPQLIAFLQSVFPAPTSAT